MLELIREHRLKLIALAILGVIGLGVLYYLLQQGYDLKGFLLEANEQLKEVASSQPLLFLGLVILFPLLSLPVSPLLLLAGHAYGTRNGILLSMLGLAITDALGYYIAASAFRGTVEKLLKKQKIKIPEVSRANAIAIIALFRLAPGFPLTFQNYLLGFARVPFKPYMVLSVLIQCIPVVGFVIFGGSIFDGDVKMIAIGVSLLVFMAIAAKYVHGRAKKATEAEATASGE